MANRDFLQAAMPDAVFGTHKGGQEEVAQSWVNNGPNKEIAPPQLKQAIGADALAALEKQTGLSQDELIARLSRELPTAVDKYTPDGRLPGQNT